MRKKPFFSSQSITLNAPLFSIVTSYFCLLKIGYGSVVQLINNDFVFAILRRVFVASVKSMIRVLQSAYLKQKFLAIFPASI